MQPQDYIQPRLQQTQCEPEAEKQPYALLCEQAVYQNSFQKPSSLQNPQVLNTSSGGAGGRLTFLELQDMLRTFLATA